MTELDDELASAYLDDDASTEERARVEGDPALRDRVEQLRRARDLLASSSLEPAPESVRELAIRAALDATVVIDLTAERARRRVRWASIAAAIVVVLGVTGILARSLGDSSSTSTDTAAGRSAASSAKTGAEQAPSAAQTAGAAAPFATARAPLGTFDDRANLVAAVRGAVNGAQQRNADAAVTPDATTDESRCAASAPANASLVFRSSAVLQGAAVLVDVFVLADGSHQVVVTIADNCSQLFTQAL